MKIMKDISIFIKKLLTIIFFLALTGCASHPIMTGQINQSHEIVSLGKKTYALFNVYEISTINSGVLERNLDLKFEKSGLKRVNPKNEIPQFFIFYGATTDYGVNFSYEHGFTLFAYDVDKKKKVYSLFSRYEDNEQDPYLSALNLINKKLPAWPGKIKYDKAF